MGRGHQLFQIVDADYAKLVEQGVVHFIGPGHTPGMGGGHLLTLFRAPDLMNHNRLSKLRRTLQACDKALWIIDPFQIQGKNLCIRILDQKFHIIFHGDHFGISRRNSVRKSGNRTVHHGKHKLPALGNQTDTSGSVTYFRNKSKGVYLVDRVNITAAIRPHDRHVQLPA